MKIKFSNTEKNNYGKFSSILKKNMAFVFLICTTLAVVIFVQMFNYIKDQNKKRFFDILNNIYFEKTLHSFVDKLNPKYIDIKHKILSGENFNGILRKYEISQS